MGMGGRPCCTVATAVLLAGGLVAPAMATTGLTASAVSASAAPTAAMVDLGTLPGGTYSTAAALNAAGQVAGDADTAAGWQHAVRWTAAGGMQDLGTLGGPFSEAVGINGAGQVAGAADTVRGPGHAFRWTG